MCSCHNLIIEVFILLCFYGVALSDNALGNKQEFSCHKMYSSLLQVINLTLSTLFAKKFSLNISSNNIIIH